MTASTHDHPATAGVWPRLRTDTRYLLSGLPLAIAGFVPCTVLLGLGVGTVLVGLGLPVLAWAVLVARRTADVERLRLPAVLDKPALRPRYRVAPAGASRLRRMVTPLTDVQSWLDLLYAVLGWIPATVGFTVAVAWWAGAAGGLTGVIWLRFVPYGPDNHDLPYFLGLPDDLYGRIACYGVLGLGLAVSLPVVLRATATLIARCGVGVLSGLAVLQHRISGLAEQRDSAVSAEATALRRLERDLHDGPQQRLVRLAMDLSRARRQLHTDPAVAEATIGEALDQARETLGELRTLSRGIAPPILTDRGLPAALAAVAGRCTVPVTLLVPQDLPRLPAAVEHTGYFLVAEALTNVAKHSQAATCTVCVALAGGRLTVDVVDDGVGGAHVAKGHGLAGLAERVAAAGGTWSVTSPAGGPTELRAVLPCG